MNRTIILLSACLGMHSAFGTVGEFIDETIGTVAGALGTAVNAVSGEKIHHVQLEVGHIKDGDTLVVHESDGHDVIIHNIITPPKHVTVEKTVTTYTK